MSNLCLPELVTVDLVTLVGTPYSGPPVVFSIRTAAQQKNGYRLGPFFSDGSQLRITADQLRLSVEIHLDYGIMDFMPIEDCFAFVQIAHWSAPNVARQIELLKSDLEKDRFSSGNQRALLGSPRQYYERLRTSANARMDPSLRIDDFAIRGDWDGSVMRPTYMYRVPDISA